MGQKTRQGDGDETVGDHEPYSMEELRNVLEYIDFPKGKLLITILAESGLRIHAVLGLKYKHIKDDFEKGTSLSSSSLTGKNARKRRVQAILS
jgi:integrase